jgi:dihydroflavonol-4-reductase
VAADKVLVTGASGFVGSAVAHALRSGYRVRALLRQASSRKNLGGLDLEIAEGDMRDPLAVARAMAGVRFLFHVAADYRLWARKPQEILHNNKEGTRVLMQTALAQGVERIVYTSSVATIACSAGGPPADETMQQSERYAIGAYKQSKIAAERIVEELITSQDLPAIIVHPTAPIGPRDQRPTPTGRIVIEAASGRIPGFVDTGLNVVHVDDVADGHLAALLHAKPGDHYILGGQNVTFADFLAEIAAMCGREPPKLRLPRHLMYPFALAAQAMAHKSRTFLDSRWIADVKASHVL